MLYDLSAPGKVNIVLTEELQDTRRKLAALLYYTTKNRGTQKRLSQNEISKTLETTRDMVNNSLVSLREYGAIHIHRHRISINEPVLAKILAGDE